MKRSVIAGLYVLLLLPFFANAQKSITDTVHVLPETSVTGSRQLLFAPGMRVRTPDSLLLAMQASNDLGSILSESASIFIKTYGPGNISTPSFRGTGPAHTAVMWNGVNIQNPMNGGADLSLIKASSAGKISIQSGGSGSLAGSGAVGGVIHLDPMPEFGRGLRIHHTSSFASFGVSENNSGISWSGRSLTAYAMVNSFRAENDFLYRNSSLAGIPEQRMQHAAVASEGITAGCAYRHTSGFHASLNLWVQQSQREVPPLMFQQYSLAVQGDDALRIALTAGYQGKKTSTSLKTALLHDGYSYDDPEKSIFSDSRSEIIYAEIENRYIPSERHLFSVAAGSGFTRAWTDYYSGRRYDTRPFLLLSYRFIAADESLVVSMNVREEIFDGAFQQPVPSLGIELPVSRHFRMYANTSRSFRVPTLNDRFWVPGGNQDLQNESGWSTEAGGRFILEKGKWDFSADISAYSMDIKKWIIWQPGNAYWSPVNLNRVWSRGAEAEVKLRLSHGNSRWMVLPNYTLVFANIVEGEPPKIAAPLIYVPRHLFSANLAWQRKRTAVALLLFYTSEREKDYLVNTIPLQAYSLSALRVSQSFVLRNMSLFVKASCENLFNSSYTVIAYRPQPGRSFHAAIGFEFNQPLKNKNP